MADPGTPVIPEDDELRSLFADARTIAVVGLSSKPGRPSLDVAAYLQARGYRIVPINPRETEVLGEVSYPTLRDVPGDLHIDIVDVFRRPEDTPEVARDAVAIGAQALWLQDSIVSEEAGAIASAAGLQVIMGTCIRRTSQRLDRTGDQAAGRTEERAEERAKGREKEQDREQGGTQ